MSTGWWQRITHQESELVAFRNIHPTTLPERTRRSVVTERQGAVLQDNNTVEGRITYCMDQKLDWKVMRQHFRTSFMKPAEFARVAKKILKDGLEIFVPFFLLSGIEIGQNQQWQNLTQSINCMQLIWPWKSKILANRTNILATIIFFCNRNYQNHFKTIERFIKRGWKSLLWKILHYLIKSGLWTVIGLTFN